MTFQMHQLHPICNQKPSLMLKIQEILLPEIVYTYTKNKKKTNIIVKPIHTSFHSESKIYSEKNLKGKNKTTLYNNSVRPKLQRNNLLRTKNIFLEDTKKCLIFVFIPVFSVKTLEIQ